MSLKRTPKWCKKLATECSRQQGIADRREEHHGVLSATGNTEWTKRTPLRGRFAHTRNGQPRVHLPQKGLEEAAPVHSPMCSRMGWKAKARLAPRRGATVHFRVTQQRLYEARRLHHTTKPRARTPGAVHRSGLFEAFRTAQPTSAPRAVHGSGLFEAFLIATLLFSS